MPLSVNNNSKITLMAKLYSKKPLTTNPTELNPKQETVKFLLDYSKALSVIHCNKLKFEALLN